MLCKQREAPISAADPMTPPLVPGTQAIALNVVLSDHDGGVGAATRPPVLMTVVDDASSKANFEIIHYSNRWLGSFAVRQTEPITTVRRRAGNVSMVTLAAFSPPSSVSRWRDRRYSRSGRSDALVMRKP